MENIIIQAAAATSITKVLVDMSKLGIDAASGRILMLYALVYGLLVAFLLLLSSEAILNRQTVSMTILVGILAAGGAVGVTEIQKKAQTQNQT